MLESKPWVVVIAALLVGAILAGGAVYFVQKQQADQAAQELLEAQAKLAATESALEELEMLGATSPAVTTTEPVEPATQTAPTPAPNKPLRQFAFITTVNSGAKPTLSADFAEFLSGDAAARAASAHNDESPPPNDYYIVNDNRKVRVLSVAPNATVTLVSNPDGTSDPAGYSVDFETWANYFAAPSDENAAIRQGGYWLTIENGKVTGLSEQFLP